MCHPRIVAQGEVSTTPHNYLLGASWHSTFHTFKSFQVLSLLVKAHGNGIVGVMD